MTDPGNAAPEQWAEPFDPDDLADLLGLVDNPTDPIIVAGLAGTLYDPSGEVADNGN